MVLLSKQFQHDLIPRAHAASDDVALISQIKEFRDSMFGLFQQKITQAIAALPSDTDEETQYRHIRYELDTCPEVAAVHRQRGEWQDRLWARVLETIEADRDRLNAVYAAHQVTGENLALQRDFVIPLHQRKADIHRMPGGYHLDDEADEFGTGLLYDHGTFLYGRGWFGPLNDELGQTLIHQVLAQHYPDRKSVV